MSNCHAEISPTTFTYVALPAGLAKRITAEMNRAGATKLLPSPSTHSEALTGVTSQEVEEMVERIYRETMAQQWDLYAAQQLLLQESEAEMQFGARSRSRSIDTNLDDDALDADTEYAHSTRGGLTMGYVTRDRCPGKGDDIEHVPGELLRFSPKWTKS
jgi:hypothetical protein